MTLLALAARAQDYAFPASAEDYPEFYPTAYVDHGGVTDWACSDLTYEGHHGSDFGGGSWAGMQEGRDIVAAAPGVVVATNDGEFDECSTGDCDGGGGFGNYVEIQHADGKYTWYGHLKQWSVLVSAGQAVRCGQKLGEMGSSGHSTGPHVHFEVRTSDGSYSDPFDGDCSAPPTYWVDQGDHGALPGLVCDDVDACVPVGHFSCGESVSTANTATGATTGHAAYGCGEYTYSGSEIAWSFATDQAETVTIALSGNTADVDLFVLASDRCDATDALGCSTNGDADAESVTFAADAGVVYTVVADGWEGAATGFTLSATCAGRWPGGDTGAPDTDPPDSAAPDSASSDSAAPETTGSVPGTRVRLDALGCGGSGAPAVLLLLGLRRRKR